MWRLFVIVLSAVSLHAGNLLHHLKVVECEAQPRQIEPIDCIYVINLDSRPEKYRACMVQCEKYGIKPFRFSAVVGKALSEQVAKEVGLKFGPGMTLCEGLAEPGGKIMHFYNERMYGLNCFYKNFSRGALGCALSHLSILQHAYDQGYEMIWILEDDFLMKQDPHLLTKYIEQLTEWVGEDNWDILHTDDVHHFTWFGDLQRPDYEQITKDAIKEHPEYYGEYFSLQDRYADKVDQMRSWWVKRLKKSYKTHGKTKAFPDIHPDFRYITGRFFTHSMIIKRSAMRKILDFEDRYGICLPYDDEISLIPFLNMFNLKCNLVTRDDEAVSDTATHTK